MAMRGILTTLSLAAFPLAGAVGLILAFGACSDASGDVKGGQWRDFDAASPANFVNPISEPTYEDAKPDTWTGIYRDYFGRRAKSSCAGNGTCHGGANENGVKSSNFVCTDLAGCYQSLRASKHPDPRVSTVSLVENADKTNPSGAYLFRVIRYRNEQAIVVEGRGMPQLPRDFAFQNSDVVRMQAWVLAGAKAD